MQPPSLFLFFMCIGIWNNNIIINAQNTVLINDVIPNVPGQISPSIGSSSAIIISNNQTHPNYYVSGGRTSSSILSTSFIYQHNVETITATPILPIPLAGHSTIYYRDYILIFGGEMNNGLTSNKLYIAKTTDYTFAPINQLKGSVPLPRAYHTAQIYARQDKTTNQTNSVILIIHGGISNEGIPLSDTWICSIEKDPMTDSFSGTWIKPYLANYGTNVPVGRFSHGSTIINNQKLIIHGGRTNILSIMNTNEILSDVWSLDLTSDFTWTRITTNGDTVSRFGHIVFGRWHSNSNTETSIGIYGGYGNNNNPYILNMATSTWTMFTVDTNSTSTFTSPLYATGAYNVFTDTLYVYGGFNFNGKLPNNTFFNVPINGLVYTGITAITSLNTLNGKIQKVNFAPSLVPVMIDCQVDNWSEWSPCMSEVQNDVNRDNGYCREAKRYRSRNILVQPSGGGAACPPLMESVRCGPRPCRVDSTVRWAGFEDKEEVNDVFDMAMVGQSSSSESGAFIYVGSYSQYSYRDGVEYTMGGLTPTPNLLLSCVASPPNITATPNVIVSHSYMNFRSIDVGGYVYGTIAIQGTGTDNATTVSVSPNVTVMDGISSYSIAMGGHFLGNLTGTINNSPATIVSTSSFADIYITSFNISYARLSEDGVYPVSSIFNPSLNWISLISGNGRKELKKVSYTEDGKGLMVAGQFSGSSINFPSSPCGSLANRDISTNTTANTTDGFIARFNALNGTCEWVVYIGGNGTQTLSNIAIVGSNVFAIGTSVGRTLEVSRLNVPSTYRVLTHAYSNPNITSILTTRTDGYLVAFSANNGSMIIATLLNAMNDTSNIIPTHIFATLSYAGSNPNGFIITIGGVYNGQISLLLSGSTKSNIPNSLITSTSKVNTLVGNTTVLTNANEGFIVRYDWKNTIFGNNTLLWRVIATANYSNVALSALSEAPSTYTVPFASYNGTVHAIFSHDGTNTFNVSTFTRSMKNPPLSGGSAMYFGFSGKDGAPLYSHSIGNAVSGKVNIAALVATDRQVIYSGYINSTHGLSLTQNTSATGLGISTVSVPPSVIMKNSTVSGMDVFAVSITAVEPFAPVNCIVGEWGMWSTCARNCSSYGRARTRSIISAAANGGTCTDLLIEQIFDCGTNPCLGGMVNWNITVETPYHDEIATIATSPMSNDLFILPSMRIRNDINSTGGSYRLIPTMVSSTGSALWSNVIDNVTAPDFGQAFSSPIVTSMLTPRSFLNDPVLIVGGTIKQSAAFGVGTPLNPVGSGVVSVHNVSNGKFIASLTFGYNDRSVPPAYGLAVAYSPLVDMVYVGGRYMQNVTIRINTSTVYRETTHDEYSMSVNQSTALVSSFSLIPEMIDASWTIAVPSVAGISTIVNSLTVSKDGSILFILGSATRNAGAPSTLNITFQIPIPPELQNMTGMPNMFNSISIPIMELLLADREYLYIIAVDAVAGMYLWSRALIDVGPSTGLIGPIRETPDFMPDLAASPGNKATITIGDDPLELFVASTYNSMQDQFFGAALIPTCNYNAYNNGTCIFIGKLDTYSGIPMAGTLIHPTVMDSTTTGYIRLAGISSNAGVLAVSGTFTTPTVYISDKFIGKLGVVSFNNTNIGMRNNANATSDVFVALYNAEWFGFSPEAAMSLWTSNSTYAVYNPLTSISTNGQAVYLSASMLEKYNNTALWTRKAYTYSFDGPGIQCHSACRTCFSGSRFACTSCPTGMFMVNGTCIDECPLGQYGDTVTGGCSACHSSCATCSGPTANDCTLCRSETNTTNTKLLYMNTCVSDCAAVNPYLGNCFGTNKCISNVLAAYSPGSLCNCHSSCYTCSGPAATQCTSCPAPNLLYFNITTGTSTCISPNACYLSAGYGRVDNVTGQFICLPFVCPSAVVPFYSTSEIYDMISNMTINVTNSVNITVDFWYNISAKVCQAAPSATPTASITPSATMTRPANSSASATPSMTPYPSYNGTVYNGTAYMSASPTYMTSASPTIEGSAYPSAFPINCTIEEFWSNWSTTCADLCSTVGYTTPDLRIYRSKGIVNASQNGGYCPSEFSPERIQYMNCICPSSSRTPLPSPVSTCYNNMMDGFESDIDCGGDLGCPRCLAGRRCYKTLDCIGDASSETLAFLQKYNYTGQAFVCSQTGVKDNSDGRGICTDARLSIATYGNNTPTEKVPNFVEFKLGFNGIPTKAPVNFLINWIREAVWKILNTTNPTLAVSIPVDFIVVANVNVTLSPVKSNSTDNTNSSNPSASPSPVGNNTGNSSSVSPSTSAVASPSASSSISPSSSALANGTISTNGTNTTTNGTNTTTNGTIIYCSGSNSTNCTNATSGSNSTNSTGRRILYGSLPSRLRSSLRYSRMLADETIGYVSDVTFTIRIIIPETVNTTTALSVMSSSVNIAPSLLVNSLSIALNNSNYTDPAVPFVLTVDLLTSDDTNNNGTTPSIFTVVQPLPPLVEITVVPASTPATTAGDSGAGGAGGAVGAVVGILFVGFFGIAFYYVRSTGSFLGCTFGPVADCCGMWPLNEYAERNRQAIKNKAIWNGKDKDTQVFVSPLPGKKKVLSGEESVCPPVDVNEILSSHTVMNPVHGARKTGGSAHFNVTYDNFDNNPSMYNNNNNNRQNFAPMGNNMYSNMGNNMYNNNTNMMQQQQQAMTMGMHINMVQQQQQQQIAMNPLRAMQQPQMYNSMTPNMNMMVTFNPMDPRMQQSALKIQSIYRGHKVRRQTHTEAFAARMGKAALKTNNVMNKSIAQGVARAAGQLAAVENKSKQAHIVSSMAHTKKAKKQMTELEAALLVQRMYKGFKLRKALKGWIKVVDDDGDVFYKNELTDQLEWLLPSMPFRPPGDDDESENNEEGEVDYEYDDDGYLWYLDGPGGARLAYGWRRCEEGDDVWYVNDDEGESSWEPVYADA